MKAKRILVTFTLIISCFILYKTTALNAQAAEVKTMDQFSKQVESNLLNYKTNFTIKYTGNMSTFETQARKTLPKIIDNNDVVSGTLKYYKQIVVTSSKKGEIRFIVQYYTTQAKSKKADALIKAQAQKINKSAKTDFLKIKAVNDYIVKNTTYGGSGTDRYTAYGLMNNHQAVCQGYALATYKMLQELKIPVRYVVGRSHNQEHAWNKVKLNGKWYNLDTTWNDPTPNSPTEVHYNYFLISDKQLAKDHTWKKANYPASTSTKYDTLADESSAVLVGNVFYYSSIKNKEKLYSFNIVTNKVKKVSNTRVQYLTYAKGKLYFSNYSNGAYLYSMKTNGKSLKKLNKKNSKNLQIKGSYLHYQVGNKKYKTKI